MNRYIAQERMREIGKEGQEKLSRSRVLVVGCGALGSPIAMYLAGAGVGSLIIADFDTIDTSNLHRQVFYFEKERGESKAESLKQRISALNSEVQVETVRKLVTRSVLEAIAVNQIDAIIDAADNPATTYLLDSWCKEHDIPFSTAGITGWNAQIFTFIPGSFSFADIFPQPNGDEAILPCSMAGIAGPVAAFAASLQSVEILKILTGNAGGVSRLYAANLLKGDITTAAV